MDHANQHKENASSSSNIVPKLVVEDWSETVPPPQILNPVQQLDDYLATIDKGLLSSSSSSSSSPLAQKEQQQKLSAFLDDLLNVTAFLFGPNMLQAALTLLEGRGAGSITKVSTAHRSMFVVHGSYKHRPANSNNNNNNNNNSNGDPYSSNSQSSSYMCLLSAAEKVEYCSCRSFLEKTIKEANGRNRTICKHLLALKLMPYVQISCSQITTNTETEFANLVLDRTMGLVRR